MYRNTYGFGYGLVTCPKCGRLNGLIEDASYFKATAEVVNQLLGKAHVDIMPPINPEFLYDVLAFYCPRCRMYLYKFCEVADCGVVTLKNIMLYIKPEWMRDSDWLEFITSESIQRRRAEELLKLSLGNRLL